MSAKQHIREWLLEYNYGDIANLINQVMEGWKLKDTKTRRNWWDVLAGNKNGTQKKIDGIPFPILKAAQLRKGLPVTNNAICHNETEIIPGIINNGRWPKKDVPSELG